MKKTASPFAGLVKPRQTVYEAAAAILGPLYEGIVTGARDVCSEENLEPLHELRIALRRLRAGLRLFGPWLPPAGYDELDVELRRLNRGLGEVRDSDVWLEFCRQLPAKATASAWTVYLTSLAGRQRTRQARLKRLLQASATGLVLERLHQIVTIDLPALERRGDPVPVSLFAAYRLSRFFSRMEQHRAWRQQPCPAAFHAARRFFRRERYVAEFLMPGCGAVAGDFGSRLKALSASLGTVHDMDRAAARIADERIAAPVGLRRMIAGRRSEALADFEAGWQELISERYRRRFFRKLKRGGV
jgi:CHAD domain-containing protein